MPNRPTLNATFLAMAIASGLTSAITNPIESEIRRAILAADVMMGNDENCMTWINANRQEAPLEAGAQATADGRPRRERRFRRE